MTGSADPGLAVGLAILAGIGGLFALAVYVWYAFALSRLFPRIGGEGWKGWVPVLNEAEILARGGVAAWKVVFFFIPIVQLYGLYLKIVATHRINARFGRGAGSTVLAVLLPPVWASLLAWGVPPYPEGERLAALQPGPRRSAPPAQTPTPDAGVRTVASFAPPSVTSAQAAGPAPLPPSAVRLVPPVPPTPITGAPSAVTPAPPPPAWSAPPAPVAPPVASPAQPPVRPAPSSEVMTPPIVLSTSTGPQAQARVTAPEQDPPSATSGDADADELEKTIVVPRRMDEALEATVVVARRRGIRRSLVLDDGRSFSLSGASVVIGRNPTGDPGEQRLAISDTTQTLSKTHARLVVQDDEWRLTDLDSTNGVVIVADDGTETLLDRGESVVGNGRFVLGEVGMRVVAETTA